MKSFVYAFRGISYVIRTERNMRIHICFAFYVILAGIVTELTAGEWAAVLICIGVVTAFECLNTAIENLCDTVHPGISKGIKHAKDAASGAVLCAAIASAVTGLFIFFREDKLNAAFEFARDNPIIAGIIILMLIPLIIFVKGKKDK